jgi:hypothetical protein
MSKIFNEQLHSKLVILLFGQKRYIIYEVNEAGE